jgi:hypothetical protein
MCTDEFRAVERLGECLVEGRVAVIVIDRRSGPSPLLYALSARMVSLLVTVSTQIPEAVPLLGPLEFFVDDGGEHARWVVPLLSSGLFEDTWRRGPACGSSRAPAIWKIRDMAIAGAVIEYVSESVLKRSLQ